MKTPGILAIQSEENPLGEGGEALHEWVVRLAAWRRSHRREGGEVNASSEIFEQATTGTGAVVMGRNMFEGVAGPARRPPTAQLPTGAPAVKRGAHGPLD